MDTNVVKLLIVEDNPGDLRFISEELADAMDTRFELDVARRLSEARQQVGQGKYDAILLDLGLPDSQGLETITSLQEHGPIEPVIVLTGVGDQELATNAIRSGAQDYLVKGDFNTRLLTRTIRYAIERQRLQEELEVARQQAQQDRDLAAMDKLATAHADEPAPQCAPASMRQHLPIVFADLARLYEQLLEGAIDEQVVKADHHTSDEVMALAEQLERLRAGPGDVIDIHSQAIKQCASKCDPRKAQIYLEEGRLMVLRLMGHLAARYRTYSFTAQMNNAPVVEEEA